MNHFEKALAEARSHCDHYHDEAKIIIDANSDWSKACQAFEWAIDDRSHGHEMIACAAGQLRQAAFGQEPMELAQWLMCVLLLADSLERQQDVLDDENQTGSFA